MSGLVGALTGPIGLAATVGSSTLLDAGQGYDFAIGGLGFHLAINDEQPYERATAQFRKEQVDTTASYGDHSLTGLWTRGQFSFHKGAGVDYYDVTEGETVLNRYKESLGIDPFTPGEVRLARDWVPATASVFNQITDIVALGDGASSSYVALIDGFSAPYDLWRGQITSGDGAVAFSKETTGTTRAVTGGGGFFYSVENLTEIVRWGAAVGGGTTLYTHSATIDGIHYAKDRLFIRDTAGDWYQLAPNPTGVLPVATTSADKVFTALAGFDWSVVETPGPVLFARGNRIYSVTQNDSGGFPTLTAPIVVAELPVGEDIRGISYYLGFVGINTLKGVRIAVLSDNGQLTYGPLLNEWFSVWSTTIARSGNAMFFSGGTNGSFLQVDLSQQVGDGLEFAYAEMQVDPSMLMTLGGGVIDVRGRLVAWDTTRVQKLSEDVYNSSGTLTTGFHRFNTPELKKFHNVLIRVGGTTGTVGVAKVLSTGTVVPLYTFDAATSSGGEITLSMDEPAEMVGLKFTLTAGGGGTGSPVLLGYQLRALPSPKRQRMIRVPLSLHDVERRGTTRSKGHIKSAWERLRALEDMEESGGTFIFQDFRTGESGQCEIQSIEHRGTTPPGRQSDGFGGLVWVTLKKL